MKNESHTFSKRYYIFRHDPTNTENDTVMYRSSTGWRENFDNAQLWASHARMTAKAKKLAAQLRDSPTTKNFRVVVGQVIVEVAGMFPLEVVDI